MGHDGRGEESIPIGYTSAGEPRLFAVPLTVDDLCAPAGTWSVLCPPSDDHPQVAGRFTSVVFPTLDIGYVRATDGLLLKSVDGGQTWGVVRHDLPSASAPLAFPTPSHGFLGVRRVRLVGPTGRAVLYEASMTLVTAQTLLHTTDGGGTWDLLTPLVDVPRPTRNRAFLPSTRRYDSAALLAQLQDAGGGTDAPPSLPGTLGYLRQVLFPTPEVGYALVEVGVHRLPAGYVLLHSDDNGQTWQTLISGDRLGPALATHCMRFPQPDAGFVSVQQALLCTEDGGRSWDARGYPEGSRPASLVFSTVTIGYALAASRLPRVIRTQAEMAAWNSEARLVFRTEDAGRHWQPVGRVAAVEFLDCPGLGVVLASGGGGQVQRSADGGHTWEEVDTGTRHGLQAVSCPNEKMCYGVADDATILKSTDGGQQWQVLTTGLTALYDRLGSRHLLKDHGANVT